MPSNTTVDHPFPWHVGNSLQARISTLSLCLSVSLSHTHTHTHTGCFLEGSIVVYFLEGGKTVFNNSIIQNFVLD